ncbi:MAG: RIP metalloprotease RseP [Gammaproteobacteria bacterium]|nr:RIP metalloprotease RseP [Gammaproteobacteria bacterium]
MTIIESIVAFLVVILVLVAVHELGHYWAARACGVRVLRFAIGFGKPVIKHTDSSGTEWVICPIPLGGYVRMLQSEDPDFKPGDEAQTFDRTSAPRRIIIAIAGPLANLVLAAVAMWGVLLLGSMQPYAITGEVTPGSIADRAGVRSGELIVGVDGRDTETVRKVGTAVIRRIGEGGVLTLQTGVLGRPQAPIREYRLDIDDWSQAEAQESPFASLGLRLSGQYIVGVIEEGSAADTAGVEVHDRILAIDGVPMATVSQTIAALQGRPHENLVIQVDRAGQARDLNVRLGAHEEDGRGFLGVGLARQEVRYGPIEGIPVALQETYELSGLLFDFIGKLFTREMDTSGVGGPVAIASVARDAALMGASTFLQVLALLSINLFLINLIPLPLLDGGHVLLASVEGITRRRLPQRIQLVGAVIGVAFIALLMSIALYNDFLSLIE